MPDVGEEFEVWFMTTVSNPSLAPFAIRKDMRGGYCYEGADKAWKAWQASRATLKVELPTGKSWFVVVTEEEELHKHRGYGWSDCLNAVGEALQQAGIEVKNG